MAKTTAAQAVKRALEACAQAWPYWYACSGERATAALLDAKIRQYPGMWTAARVAKARAEIGRPHVADCVGFMRWCCEMQKDREALCTNAEGLRQKSGPQPLKTLPETPGALVFIPAQTGRVGHVGMYVGGGRVAESYNFKRVENRPLSAQTWTHWGFCPWIDYENAKSTQKINEKFTVGDRVRVRQTGLPYYPGGATVPEWLAGRAFTVQQTGAKKGGAPCVLLKEITSYCAEANLTKV
jgi:hypothetical protein